jgi:hypothetical protein
MWGRSHFSFLTSFLLYNSRWLPRLQVATACFSCSPSDLNFLDPYFTFMYMHNNHCHRATAHLQLNLLLLLLLLIPSNYWCFHNYPSTGSNRSIFGLIGQSGKCRTRIKSFSLSVIAQRASWHPPVRLCSPDAYSELNRKQNASSVNKSCNHGRSIPASDSRMGDYFILPCDNFVCSTVICFVRMWHVILVTHNFIQGVLMWGYECCSIDEGNVPCLTFCWPCITVYQYRETNVMQFLFSLLRVKGLYMFRALLSHPQEAIHKRHLVYCYVSWLHQGWSSTPILVQPTDITHTQYTKCRLFRASWGWTSNAPNM